MINVASASHILQQMERELDAHVANQNKQDRLTYFHRSIERECEMREIKDLGDTLRGTIQQLRTQTAQAKDRFAKEVKNTQANISKVNSFSDEMSSANKEVEALLADTGSNFPDPDGVQGTTTAPKANSNGVVVNKG